MSSNQSRSRQEGFSLSEVLVATAILVIVFVGILMLYDRGNRVFKSGNEAAEAQQNLRIAYERMVGDVRMAGFDFKRGGPLLPGQSAAPWAQARQYSAGTLVTPSSPNGHVYRAQGNGTSGTSEPTWPTNTGDTVIETGATPPITWQEYGGAVYEQPDEQIEYAGATALTVRANYDYSQNPIATDHGREVNPNYETPNFPIVTTGNDEIVTYALVSNQAPSGTAPNNQSITMYLDMNNGAPNTTNNKYRDARPGGRAETLKTIDGIDLTNNNPPYTLYRFVFDNNGNVQRTALADNIRSLNFFYYSDPAGKTPLKDAANALAPNIGGGGQYDPSVAGSISAADRLVRRTIRSVRVRLVGMQAQSVQDTDYGDTSTANGQLGSTSSVGVPTFVADTIAPHSRRTTVDTLIVPRNLGMTGMPQTFLQPPPAPTINSVCYGFCGIVVVNWDPNTANPNASYSVSWDTDPSGSFSNSFDAGTSNTYAIDLTQQDLTDDFYFKVRAYNAGGGATSAYYGPVSAKNMTTPNGPTSIQASGGGTISPISGKIHLTWSAPISNASGSPTCAPSGTPGVNTYLREIQGFRIYRDTDPNFNAGPTNKKVDESSSGPTAPQTDGYGNYWWDDTNVICGTTYYYRVRSVEWCHADNNYNSSGNTNSAWSDITPPNSVPAVGGQAGTTGTPQAPVNFVTAPESPITPPLGMTNSVCNSSSNTCMINMHWTKVTMDTTPSPVAIDTYEVERRLFDPLTGNPLTAWASLPPAGATVSGALTSIGSMVDFTDTAQMFDPMTTANHTYQYRVRATQGGAASCPPGNWSDIAQFPPPCTFAGSIIYEAGASAGDGYTPATAWVMNTGDTIEVKPPANSTMALTAVLMRVIDPSGNVVYTDTQTGVFTAAAPAHFQWQNQTPGTPYTVTFTITNDATPPCSEQAVRYIQQEPIPACSITTFALDNSVLQQTGTDYQLQLNLRNSATEALTMTSLLFNWTVPFAAGNNATPDFSWNSIKFPSAVGATMTGPGSTGGNFTFTLSPKPAQLNASDVTIPASGGGTRTILINMAKLDGNPPNITPAIINSICVSYTRTSVTQPGPGGTQVPIPFHCQIKPDQSVNNPTSCQ